MLLKPINLKFLICYYYCTNYSFDGASMQGVIFSYLLLF